MADQEIAKHTKKVYKIWNSKQHSPWHKVQEFFIEIVIIVFAVSISIWFHNMSEHSHNQKEAKAFLVGLQSDLVKDIAEMQQDSLSFEEQQSFFGRLADKSAPEMDSVSLVDRMYLFSNRTVLIPNVSRFEALKYSGKMALIEDKELLDEILNLYEEKIPSLIAGATAYFNFKEKHLIELLDKDRLISRYKLNELRQFIRTDEDFNYQLKRSKNSIRYILQDYHNVITLNKKLVTMIANEIK